MQADPPEFETWRHGRLTLNRLAVVCCPMGCVQFQIGYPVGLVMVSLKDEVADTILHADAARHGQALSGDTPSVPTCQLLWIQSAISFTDLILRVILTLDTASCNELGSSQHHHLKFLSEQSGQNGRDGLTRHQAKGAGKDGRGVNAWRLDRTIRLHNRAFHLDLQLLNHFGSFLCRGKQSGVEKHMASGHPCSFRFLRGPGGLELPCREFSASVKVQMLSIYQLFPLLLEEGLI